MQPLKVSSNRQRLVLGILAILFGIIGSIYFYFNNNYEVARCFAPLFGLTGIVLLLVSWGWVEANEREITTRSLFQTSTVKWDRIIKIDTISSLGMIILRSDESRVDLIPSGWAGQDKEQLLRLLESKIKSSGAQSEEYRKFP